MAKTIVTICSSVAFYEQVNDIKDELESAGLTAIVPSTALRMKAAGDYDVSHYKTWYDDANDYHRKTELMREHFDRVAEADAILVVNNEKHGIANYIGGNVLMEMALALHLGKPIFLLNQIPDESSFLEEIIGLNPIVLDGELDKMTEYFNNDLAPVSEP